ncbi:Polysaccharide biosynthesis protein [Bremerella volcania]|uniref:Polysaccharide biosynthesis protein n=1 Tax=Bremerella volcania TaxID=2527984 RepID=A0A518C942_9BACT|nr:oligosaccharide flippase family protein [Bremerella volcania]QDU75739.1 Polysaccharide biosynthesis protein [Bremerella volcania]
MSKSTTTPPTPNSGEIARGIRGSSLLFAGRCLSLGMNFAIQLAAVRYFSKDEFGVYSVALSAVAVTAVFAAFGMDKTALRVLPRYQSSGDLTKFSAAALLMAVATFLCSLLAIVVIYITWGAEHAYSSPSRSMDLMLVMIWMTPCIVLDCFVTSLFSVFGKPRAIFVRQHILGPLLRLVAVIVVVLAGGGVFAFAAGQLIASLIGVLIYATLVRSLIRERNDFVRVTWKDMKSTAREVFSYSLTLIFGDVGFLMRGAMVVLIIGLFHTPSEVAGFQAVFPAARLNDIVIATFSMLFMPSAGRLFSENAIDSLNHLFRKTTVWTTVLSFPLFLACFLMPEQLCVLLFGEQYADSASTLAILSLGFFINTIVGMNLRLIRVVSGLRTLILVDVISLAGAVGTNLLLVPSWGAIGGAWAILIGFVVQGIVCMVAVTMTVEVNPMAWRLIRAYSLAAILTGGLWVAASGALVNPLWIPVLLGAASVLFAWLCRDDLEVANVFPEVARVPYLGRLLSTEQTG